VYSVISVVKNFTTTEITEYTERRWMTESSPCEREHRL
jgi:hypothetical protein